MHEAALKMVAESYEIGKVLNIAVIGLLGHVHQRRLLISDFSQEQKVNSYQKKIKATVLSPDK